MQLTAKTRAEETKGGLKQMRRAGTIPAVLYSPGQAGQTVLIDRVEWETNLRKIKQGTLSTQVFKLNVDGGKKKAIIKDIQYDPTNYRVLHMDFEELKDDVQIKVNVPVEMIGIMECAGVKAGGFLRQVKRTVKIKCLPKDIPTHYEMDVKDLAVGKSLKVSDLVMAKGVQMLSPKNEVLIVVSKR